MCTSPNSERNSVLVTHKSNRVKTGCIQNSRENQSLSFKKLLLKKFRNNIYSHFNPFKP